MQPSKHPTPEVIRWALGGRLRASLYGSSRGISGTGVVVSETQVSGENLRILCEDRRAVSFSFPVCHGLSTFEKNMEMEGAKMDQVIESMYVGALLMIGGALERHKSEAGTVMLLISDIEPSDNFWIASMGVTFVKQTTP